MDENFQKQFNESNKYTKILMDLVTLRETDYDAFMERLYEALTGEFSNAIYDGAPIEEKTKALNTMLEYFKEQEAYEKCATIQSLIKKIESSANLDKIPAWRILR